MTAFRTYPWPPSRVEGYLRFLGMIAIWLVYPFAFVHAHQVSEFAESTGAIWAIGYAAVFVLLAAGETQRRDKPPRLPQLKPIQAPLFTVGIVLLVVWG